MIEIIQEFVLTYRQPLSLAGGGLAVSLVLYGFLYLVRRLAERRGRGIPAVLAGAQKLLPPLLFVGALSLAAAEITFSEGMEFWVDLLFSGLVTAVVAKALNGLIDWFARRSVPAGELGNAPAEGPALGETPAGDAAEKEAVEGTPVGNADTAGEDAGGAGQPAAGAAPGLSPGLSPRMRSFLSLLHLLVWAVALLFFLDNLGFNISAVVAGLGISGIAVAIAAQGILGDLFNYFVIHFDRPFELGDFIIFGDKLGTVEKIGVKTTRIRAISGEQLVVSNSDLTGSRVHNYKKMQERRIVFSFGVTYQTPTRKLQALPGLIKRIIEEEPQARFDRSHFSEFGASALMLENVYYVLSPDYGVYRDVQQAINLRIKELLERNSVEMAYPTQTVYLHNPPGKG